jgi:O-antigen/teichoic acid export membrane protein
MLPYGIPLVWSALVGVGMDASGRYLLARHTGLDQVAVYTVALKISAVMQVGFLQPFGTAWSGIMFQISRNQDAPRSVTSILSVAFVAAMALAAGISIVAPLALALFGNTIYYRAAVLIPWLLLPPAFRILEYWSSLGLYLTHRTGWLAGAATGGALLNVAAISVLVPRLGALGAALSWVLALSATIVANVFLGWRRYRLPANWAALGLGLGLWAAGWVAARLVPPGFSRRSILSAAMALLLVSGPAMAYGAKKLPILRGETG